MNIKSISLILLIFLSSLYTMHCHCFTTTEQVQKVLPDNIIHTTVSSHTYKDDKEILHAYYAYPQFHSTYKQAHRLNSFYLAKMIRDYNKIKAIRDSAIQLPLQDDMVYAFDHTFEVTYHSDTIISILENTYEYAGGAHPDYSLDAHTFSLQSGKELNLEFFFQENKYKLEKKIKHYIIEEIQSEPEDYYSNAIEIITNRPLDSFRFYLKNKTLVIFFNPYEIAPYSRGIVEFSFL